ncbi:MAG TPA: polynucleotide adenylyltransferase PcnB [Novimethylophilus sp.]|jgi:poly(A) polymerase|uniref:polynucleotide adenylyltransferase PcnB n=1 Tax=Novimethylophilus sp. TaxID=2137426 RepID=UPI002F3F1D31
MIRKLLQRVFQPKKKTPGTNSDVQKFSRRTHGIDKHKISSGALKTVEGLQKAGYSGFIVGGAVRDLMLGRVPKDFDVATDATPEQVRQVFRRARIIGRRFRIVHVMFGNETIEVTTFRGSHLAVDENGESDAQVTDSGRILRDNVFGTLQEDAERRDFSINALYYNPATEEVWDYHRGVPDIKAKVLRIIGDPETRYREDPVRMLRAVRLSAKLEMQLDRATETPIPKLADLLQDVPPSRLFEEMLKLFLSGHAMESAAALRQHGLHHGVLPLLDVVLEQPMGERFVKLALKNTDDRVQQDKPVSPAFLFATLLWHEVLTSWQKHQSTGMKPLPALFEAMHEVSDIQAGKLAIPKRYSVTMKEIWGLQPRFEQRAGQRPFRLLEHERYRAGYDFLLLRCESGELPMELVEWWDRFAHADTETRNNMLQPDTAPKKRRRRRRSPNSGGSQGPHSGNTP